MFQAARSGMLIFGERKRVERPRQLLDELLASAARPGDGGESWIQRHGRLVDLFIATASLAPPEREDHQDRRHRSLRCA
jgi:hypothetical protein